MLLCSSTDLCIPSLVPTVARFIKHITLSKRQKEEERGGQRALETLLHENGGELMLALEPMLFCLILVFIWK